MPTDTDNTNPLPMRQNINIVALITAILALLVAFGLPLTTQQKEAILAVVAIAGPSAMAWLHTLVNHPANGVAAKAYAANIVNRARGIAGGLVLFLVGTLVVSGFLSGCAPGSIFPQDPKSVLQAVQYGATLAEAAYDTICLANNAPNFCTDPQARAAYQKAKAALDAAILTAAATIDVAGNVNTATVANLLATLQDDWKAYNTIVNTVQLKQAQIKGVAFKPIPLN